MKAPRTRLVILIPLALALAGAPLRPQAPAKAGPGEADANAVIGRYFAGCHNESVLAGNLSVAGVEAGAAGHDAEVAEKIIRKLRAGMMPPAGMPRPEASTLAGIAEGLEKTVDAAAARAPNPGGRTFQRLNRAEYSRA